MEIKGNSLKEVHIA